MSGVEGQDIVRDAILVAREAFIAAEQAADVNAMLALAADDLVILHPQAGVIDGKDAARRFIAQVLGEIHGRYDKSANYESVELVVSGDLAYERGRFRQTLTPRAGGPVERDEGMYLWIYRRAASGAWHVARMAGTLTSPDGPANV